MSEFCVKLYKQRMLSSTSELLGKWEIISEKILSGSSAEGSETLHDKQYCGRLFLSSTPQIMQSLGAITFAQSCKYFFIPSKVKIFYQNVI